MTVARVSIRAPMVQLPMSACSGKSCHPFQHLGEPGPLPSRPPADDLRKFGHFATLIEIPWALLTAAKPVHR